jgi:hypothetical protein
VCCWGFNTSGQCVVPPTLGKVIAITANECVTGAVDQAGSIIFWGYMDNGISPVPIAENVIAISYGGFHCTALTQQGSLVCWGANNKKQCEVPPGLTSVLAVSSGNEHNCAVTHDGRLVCWGDNSFGQCNVPENTIGMLLGPILL